MRPVAAVTGGTGFLGQHIIRALASAGWRLRLLVRRDPRLDIGPNPVEIVTGTLDDRAALAELVSGAACVIHCAGAIKARDRAEFQRINHDSTRALAEICAASAPEARFILLSTLAARAPHLSHYARSKADAEAALETTFTGDKIILRPTAVYGPGDRETLALFRAATSGMQPLLNGPGARITAIHASDVADAVAGFATNGAPTGVFELTDARQDGYSWQELVRTATTICGGRFRPVRIPTPLLRLLAFGGDLSTRISGRPAMLSSQKLQEILHPDWSSSPDAQPDPTLWHAKITLDDGFADTFAWYRDAGWIRSR